ncbi:MAG: hypothetical protein B7W95_00780 [Acidimicrobiales bacterium 20-64-4]|nr:MAG: hypothetical protein B7W95_00780 [Acidimicrobiales bacterium 20-64-4]
MDQVTPAHLSRRAGSPRGSRSRSRTLRRIWGQWTHLTPPLESFFGNLLGTLALAGAGRRV